MFGECTASTGVALNKATIASSASKFDNGISVGFGAGASFIFLNVSRNLAMSVSFNPTSSTPASLATRFGSRFASLQAVLNRSMFSWLTTPAGFGAATGCSSHSDLDQSDRQMPKRMDALRKKSPTSSLSRSGLSERTDPTPNIVLPRIVRCPHMVAMPFVSVIAGLPFTNSTGDQFHSGSMSMRMRLISA